MNAVAKKNLKSGVLACLEAFERLKVGAPHVSTHVGLPPAKITAGIVSVEAGFDRGYLKKSRMSHRGLISQIEAFRKIPQPVAESKARQIKRALSKAQRLENELSLARTQLYNVLTQNMQLVERVRELEKQLGQRGNVTDLHRA